MHDSLLVGFICFEAKIRSMEFSDISTFVHCCEKWVKAIGDDCDCQAQPLTSARRSFLQMRSGLFVAPELRDWLLVFYSLHLCSCLCLIMRDCVGEFTVCCNLIQNKVTQQNTESERCSSSASLRQKLKQKRCTSLCFFPPLIQHVSSLDGRLYEMLMCIISSEAELVYLVTLRRMCVHSERDIQINSPLWSLYTHIIVQAHQLPVTGAWYKKSLPQITAEHGSFPLLLQHTHLSLWQHTHLVNFRC